MNKVFLAGRLTADPNPIATAKNIPVTKFSIACTDSLNRTKVEFVSCTCFNQTATFANTYLKKGDFVVVEGHISINKYTNKSGTISYTTDVIVENLTPAYGNSANRNNFLNEIKELNPTSFSNVSDGQENKVSIDDEFKNTVSLNTANANETNKDDDDLDLPDFMKELDD